jgi:uncharacterized protein
MTLRIFALIIITTLTTQGQDIFSAARNNDVQQLQLYIQQGVSVDTTDARGSTPLIIAVYNHQVEASRMLLAANAQSNKQDRMGNTALMGVCFRGYTDLGCMFPWLYRSGRIINCTSHGHQPGELQRSGCAYIRSYLWTC